jgi:glycosyltransferase involved in cell wall biosynthesis
MQPPKPTMNSLQLPWRANKVSIVIPVYQRERYLNRCFHTLSHQSFFPVEVVFVDDGSTDGSLALLTQYQQTHPLAQVISLHPNRGTHYARVQAVTRANGRYIMSLDADDELFPDISADAYFIAEKYHASIVEFDCYGIVNGSISLFKLRNPKRHFMSGGELVALFQKQKMNWNLWRKLIKRSLYLRALRFLGPEGMEMRLTIGEDMLHCALVYLFTDKFVYVRMPGYLYYRYLSDNSESGAHQAVSVNEEQLTLTRSYLDRVLKLHRV